MSTDQAAVSPQVLDELLPAARHVPQRYAHIPIETGHGRLPAAQIGLLPGCGHVPIWDNPQLVAHVLLVGSA